MRYRLMFLVALTCLTTAGCAGAGLKISGSVTYVTDNTSISIRFAE